MVRWLSMAGILLSALAFSDNDEPFDVTCTDSGTRVRIAVILEAPDQTVPCRVDQITHPLGRYNMDWQTLWRAEHDPTFCPKKALEAVESKRAQGWRCMDTRDWKSTE